MGILPLNLLCCLISSSLFFLPLRLSSLLPSGVLFRQIRGESFIGAEMSLSFTSASPITPPNIARSKHQCLKLEKNVWSNHTASMSCCVQFQSFKRSTSCAYRVKRASVICAAALNATCSAEQTQTVTRQSSTITVAPIQGKEKSPELDDGGSGFPPRDDGDGGGGGGGGGGHWSGGFFFFGFLAFLGFLKDQENEGSYSSSSSKRRR